MEPIMKKTRGEDGTRFREDDDDDDGTKMSGWGERLLNPSDFGSSGSRGFEKQALGTSSLSPLSQPRPDPRSPECCVVPSLSDLSGLEGRYSALAGRMGPRWGPSAQPLDPLTSGVLRLPLRCKSREVRSLRTRSSYAGIHCLRLKVNPAAELQSLRSPAPHPIPAPG